MFGISDQAKEGNTHDIEEFFLNSEEFFLKSKARPFYFSVLPDLPQPALNNQCHQKLTSQVLTTAFFPTGIS